MEGELGQVNKYQLFITIRELGSRGEINRSIRTRIMFQNNLI